MSDTKTAYKGFNEGLVCRDFKYELDKSYKHEGAITLCGSGFHACEQPLDVFNYYPPEAGREYALVEQSGKVENGGDKTVSSEITIKTKLSLKDLWKAQLDFVFTKVKKSKETTNTSGYKAHANTSGNWAHANTSGNWAHANTSGDEAHANTSGYKAHANTSGDEAHANTSGKNSTAACLGLGGKAKAGENGLIILTYFDEDADRHRVAVGYVGEDGIKKDTWYQVVGGELSEVKNGD